MMEMMVIMMIYNHPGDIVVVLGMTHHLKIIQEERKIRAQQVLPTDKNNKEINLCKNKKK